MTQTGLVPTRFGSYLEGTASGQLAKGLYKGATSAKAAGITQKVGKGIWKVAKDPITIASAAYYFYPDGTPKAEEELEMQGPPPPGGLNKLLNDTDQKGAAGQALQEPGAAHHAPAGQAAAPERHPAEALLLLERRAQ